MTPKTENAAAAHLRLFANPWSLWNHLSAKKEWPLKKKLLRSRKPALTAPPGETRKNAIAEFNFSQGLLADLFSGVIGACFALGLTPGNPIGQVSLAAGTNRRRQLPDGGKINWQMGRKRRGSAWIYRLVMLWGLSATGVFGRAPAPEGLLVDGVSQPLAVEQDSVCFTWLSTDSRRGAAQTAYQILVASTAAGLSAATGDLWDSGKVGSDKSATVEYAGKPLPPATRCWWEVRVWDQAGDSSPFSSPASFDTGLAPGNWTARYIWDGTTNLNNFAYFRKSFALGRRPVLAKVFVSAHNDYLLYLNGHILGRGPARSDPYHYGQYNAYDITGQLRAGSNVFAAIGHWDGHWRDSGVNAEPAFILEARWLFADGSAGTVVTDDSWKVLASMGFIQTNPTYFGGRRTPNRAAIRFDARLEPEGWTAITFDDAPWANATVVDRSSFVLFPQRAPLEAEQAELPPVGLVQSGQSWLVDFGRCIDGWPKLTLPANHRGDTLRVDYFQLNGERGPSGWDEYTCRGGGETWKPSVGRYASFRELKITGYTGPLRAADVRGVWAYTGAALAGRFRCSDALVNSIYQMCERSARQCVQQAIISVDANREQSPWTADSWNIGNVLLYNHRNTMVVDKVVRDYAAEQLPCGDLYACSPAAIFRCPEWSMYWPMLLWQQYLFSDDEILLREMSPRLSALLGWLQTFQDPQTKLIDPPNYGNLSQGLRISEYAGGNLPSGGKNIATACQYYENLRIAARVFSVLEQPRRAEEYRRRAEEVKEGINAHLFQGEYYLARTDRPEMFPLAQAWPLRFDLVPPTVKPRLLAAVRAAGKPVLGGYGGDAFYSGMLQAGGMGDFVVADLARYRVMLDGNGANWERFDSRGEFNHAWTSYPGYLLQKHFSGIQPTRGGFSEFDVRPEISGLAFAESVVPTVKGDIRTRWEKIGGDELLLSLTVPANTRATLYLPKLSGPNVRLTESGSILWPVKAKERRPGVRAVKEEGDAIKCQLSAGTYEFKETRFSP